MGEGVFSLLLIRRLRRTLISVYKYLKGGSKDNGAWIFSVVPLESIRCNGHKLEHRRCHLNVRKHFPLAYHSLEQFVQ